MRALEFRDVKDGDSLPADATTPEGAAAVFSWLCPSLTSAEAEECADEAIFRGMPIAVESAKALVRTLWGNRFAA